MIATQALADDCRVQRYDQTASILKVVDGDTVVLASKQKVRLIGINTPELAHGHKKAEPYAKMAKRYLQKQLAPAKKVYLRWGIQHKDHYGRLLAHLFLEDGQNLNAMLVKQGLAYAIVVPPNTMLADCYFKLEQRAQKKEKYIWSSAISRFRLASQFNIKDTGFSLVKGTVIRIGKSKGSIWLQLAPAFTVRIKRNDFKYFRKLNLARLSVDSLKGKTLYLRGWVYQWKKKLYMRIRHPRMIMGL